MHRATAAFTFALLAMAHAGAEQLHSPWDGRTIPATDAPYTCPGPPKFAGTLNTEGYYSDSQYSVIDPVKKAAYDKASGELVHLGQFAGAAADSYLSGGSKAAATCVYSLLDAAATADAWAGQMANNVDVYNQIWLLSGAAIAYLKVRNSGVGDPRQDLEIREWFRHLSQRVRVYFDNSKGHPRSDAYNNHLYWAGLAVAAQGVAGNDQEALLWGMETYYQGVKSIEPDGSLDAEMNRAARALHYQLYALGALVMLAELGEANGIDLYSAEGGAIHRLVKFNLAAIEDPSIVARRTGVEQDVTRPLSGLEIGWAVCYGKRFPNRQLAALLSQAPWVRFWQWGGAPPDPELAGHSSSGQRVAFEAELNRRVNAAIAARFPSNPSLVAALLGTWRGQGIPTIRASITASGPYLALTNENGDASTGRVNGGRSIVAPGWQNVVGTLSPSGIQIDWTNGTYWERCPAPAGTEAKARVKLAGEWFQQSDFSHPCSIRQHDDSLQFHWRHAGRASGKIDSDAHLTLKWRGQNVGGTVTADGNHINWDDGIYWTRSTVYQASNN